MRGPEKRGEWSVMTAEMSARRRAVCEAVRVLPGSLCRFLLSQDPRRQDGGSLSPAGTARRSA